jgi:hypothetical protein
MLEARLGCFPGLDTSAKSGFVLDIRMKRNIWMNATSRWSQVRYKATLSGCVKSGTSRVVFRREKLVRVNSQLFVTAASQRLACNSPKPVRYSSASRSLISSSLHSFVLFGRPFRRAALSSSSSASCRVSHTSATSSWSSGNVNTLLPSASSSGIA